jgi:hypothetical protein
MESLTSSLNSQDIRQWLQNPSNQMIVAAAAILLLVAIWLLVRRRRRGAAERTRRLKSVDQPLKRADLKDVLESYRLSHPAFYDLVNKVQQHHSLNDLSENNEFAGATAKLRLIQAVRRGSGSSSAKAGVLRLDAERGKDSSREVRAAMVTILRILYASPEIRATLESTGEGELDRLVESLTG